MMVALWTVGDVFKTCYYKLRDAPTQFWACGLLQASRKKLSVTLRVMDGIFIHFLLQNTDQFGFGDFIPSILVWKKFGTT